MRIVSVGLSSPLVKELAECGGDEEDIAGVLASAVGGAGDAGEASFAAEAVKGLEDLWHERSTGKGGRRQRA